MMRFQKKTLVTFTGTLVLTEGEMRALDALVGYGTDSFLTAFYEKMGRAYMEPFEGGLRTLFESVKEQIRPQMHHVDEARKALDGLEK